VSITLNRSLHIDDDDIQLLDEDTKVLLLKYKMIMRADNTDEGAAELEKIFTWVKENCQNHYRVRGPNHDKDTIKYYIYFTDEAEATQFKLTFPQN